MGSKAFTPGEKFEHTINKYGTLYAYISTGIANSV